MMKKKIIVGLLGIVLLTLISTPFIIHIARKLSPGDYDTKIASEKLKKVESHPALPTPASQAKQTKKDVVLPETAQIPSEELQRIKEYVREFDIPAELEQELLEAVQNGDIDEEEIEAEVTEEELREAGLTLGQLATSALDSKGANITAGYSVTEKAFEEMFSACLPSPDSDDEQTKALKSDTLATLGFSAMAENQHKEAERAFSALIRHYPQSQAVPMVQLELARLMLQNGRVAEARQLVDEAIYQHKDDEEYVGIAKSLREEIEGYE